MGYSFTYEFQGLGLLLGLLSFPAMLIGMAGYVLFSLGLYTTARRRGIHNPWLAWIPVVNCWILGSLSDQYRYVALGQNRSKRKSLLVLHILSSVLSAVVKVLAFTVAVMVIGGSPSAAQLLDSIMGPAMTILGLVLPLVGVAIAYAVIYFMALYDVYKSMDPANCVVYLVLSILFNVTEPFFLFFNRNKDGGMPPRREAPAFTPRETWDAE